MSDAAVPLTTKQKQALEIIRAHPGIKPREFARFMWPASLSWSTHTKAGRGVTRGGGMNLAAGGYLGKLARAGLIRHAYTSASRREIGYYLTPEGTQALKTHETH